LIRQSRYKDFELFANEAKARFTNLRDADERANDFAEIYSFYAVKGGAMGGVDKRLVEVFFGNRPIDQIQTFELQGDQLPLQQHKTLIERGVVLHYQRTDAGTVVCTLFPANTMDLRQREDSIILDWIKNPKVLQSRRKIKTHWRAFISYMECTSVDGEPTVLDIIRVANLRFTRHLVIDGRIAKRKVVVAAEKILGYTLTVGLSGFLLLLINMMLPSGETEKAKAEITTVSRQLSEENEVIHAQKDNITSLKRGIDNIQKTECEGSSPANKRSPHDIGAQRR